MYNGLVHWLTEGIIFFQKYTASYVGNFEL